MMDAWRFVSEILLRLSFTRMLLLVGGSVRIRSWYRWVLRPRMTIDLPEPTRGILPLRRHEVGVSEATMRYPCSSGDVDRT